MTNDEIHRIYREELTRIAPDLDAASIGENDHIEDDLDLDSMDILNLVTALHRRLGVDIPEADYPQIATLTKATDYLLRLMPDTGSG